MLNTEQAPHVSEIGDILCPNSSCVGLAKLAAVLVKVQCFCMKLPALEHAVPVTRQNMMGRFFEVNSHLGRRAVRFRKPVEASSCENPFQ
jgi:hypothetical protein